jgi:hypothetical protein
MDGVEEPDIMQWERGDPKPRDFFILDDQLNHEMYVYVEILCGEAFTSEWLTALTRTMASYPSWGVGIIAFPKSYILAFADKLMVTGPVFEPCQDFECVIRRGREAILNGGKAKRTGKEMKR